MMRVLINVRSDDYGHVPEVAIIDITDDFLKTLHVRKEISVNNLTHKG